MTRRSLPPALALIVALSGLVDAIAGEVWDLVAVLSVVAALLVVDLVTTARRPVVTLRPDLVRWVAERAAVEGETVEAVSARAVATYRSHLLGRDPHLDSCSDPHPGSHHDPHPDRPRDRQPDGDRDDRAVPHDVRRRLP